MIDKDYNKIKLHVQKNEQRWPINAEPFQDASDFEDEILLIKNWIPSQLSAVKQYVDEL